MFSDDISKVQCNVGSKKQAEGLSNPSILSMPRRKIFDWVNSQQPVELNHVITTSLPECGTNETEMRFASHRMHCSRIPSCQVEKWKIVPFMLLVSTVSNAQAPFLHQGNE